MLEFKILLTLVLFAKLICANLTYCAVDLDHVLCTFPSVGILCNNFTEVKPTLDQREEILDLHNKIRQKVAYGSHNNKSRPPAANMMKMEWDDELAEMAQISANQCRAKIDCEDGICRKVIGDRFDVGQNIGVQKEAKPLSSKDFKHVILSWYNDEERRIDPLVIDSFRDGNRLWSRFSQLIWWNSRSVGCGGSSFKIPGSLTPYQFLVICNYGAAGNIPKAKIYTKGKACSECPIGTMCDDTYKGLCARTQLNIDVKSSFATDRIVEGLP